MTRISRGDGRVKRAATSAFGTNKPDRPRAAAAAAQPLSSLSCRQRSEAPDESESCKRFPLGRQDNLARVGKAEAAEETTRLFG